MNKTEAERQKFHMSLWSWYIFSGMVLKPTATGTPKNMLGMQILNSHLQLPESKTLECSPQFVIYPTLQVISDA